MKNTANKRVSDLVSQFSLPDRLCENENIYAIGKFDEIVIFDTITVNTGPWQENGVFVKKMDIYGNYVWAKSAYSESQFYHLSINTDANGNIFVSGSFRDHAYFGSYSLDGSNELEVFVAKMDADGNWLWAEKAYNLIIV